MTKEKFEIAYNIDCEIGLIDQLLEEINDQQKGKATLWLNKGSFYIINLIGDGYVEQMLQNKRNELKEKFKEL